jgi:hypothetical protein
MNSHRAYIGVSLLRLLVLIYCPYKRTAANLHHLCLEHSLTTFIQGERNSLKETPVYRTLEPLTMSTKQ